MKSFFPLILILLLLSSVSQAQPDNMKFGKIDISDLENNVCPIDSNSHAYYLFDVGETDFRYDQVGDKGFQLYFTRHFRVKIQDKQGLDWGNISFSLYKNNSNEEEISGLKAFTYNMDGKQVEKTKLEKSDIMRESTSENLTTVKFAMPNIKEGSIIEIEYTIVSDFLFNLQQWYFQRTIPTLYSEYTVSIPEYFNYNQTQKGYYNISTTTETKNETITFTSKSREGFYTAKTNYQTQQVHYLANIRHYQAKNIPAFPKEKFLRTPENYLSKIEYELQSTNFPQQPMKFYTTSWEEIDKQLNESEYFGREIKNGNHWKDEVETLKAGGLEGTDLISAAFELVKQKISWTGRKTKYIDTNLNKAYKAGEGNSADVNLNLVVLLRELGFKSYPVILSTKENGIIYPVHPSISSFNYVIAMVEWEGSPLLMDATDPNSLINLIPVRCLNDKGRIVGDTAEKWINLMDYKPFSVRSSYNLKLDSTMTMSGKALKKLNGYSAYYYRTKIKESTDTEECIKSLENENGEFSISNVEVKGLDSLDYDLNIVYDITETEGLNNSGAMVYFSPTLDPFFDENPLKLEKREFPVEFDYPFLIQRMYTYVLPSNYECSELPKPIAIRLPNNAGTFKYQVVNMGNILNVNSSITINKSLFSVEEYEQLKTFIQMIVDKEKELVVLKPKQI